ncbi:RnfABCDGE type electron transport complex subunit D [Roseospirillum parvum]|uniref:Ion-translocating oxidoreductase complex subunit D n=1 Tax=Roseospirillum parvum TaxID=83401 RepID=A0A1G7ZXM5_9PROT|nr:RnfABCDGE type electron transport complex subunit D [Roseospirillum parvum]SDH12950.1 electron transport complex protein RnfD [Roseospirillum parvum]
MSSQPLSAAPHAHQEASVRRIMLLVAAALLPVTLYELWLFGWPAINLLTVTLLSTLLAEAACLALARRPILPFLTDGSALLTGWLLALSLPPVAPWWTGVVGGVVAMAIGKHVFGGVGQNLFNPAMVARVVLLISFPLEMTRNAGPMRLTDPDAPGFLDGLAITFGGGANLDALSSASLLSHAKTELSRGVPLTESLSGLYDPWALAVGTVPGAMGETAALLILLGGLFLIFMRVISWHIPLAMLGTLGALAGVFHLIDPSRYADPLFHLLAGSAMLGAFFIATDLVTSPITRRGQIIFGAGCGLLVYVIRTWANYPEGVAFAILLMNALTPLIDHYVRPRVFGRTAKGAPLTYQPADREAGQ